MGSVSRPFCSLSPHIASYGPHLPPKGLASFLVPGLSFPSIRCLGVSPNPKPCLTLSFSTKTPERRSLGTKELSLRHRLPVRVYSVEEATASPADGGPCV